MRAGARDAARAARGGGTGRGYRRAWWRLAVGYAGTGNECREGPGALVRRVWRVPADEGGRVCGWEGRREFGGPGDIPEFVLGAPAHAGAGSGSGERAGCDGGRGGAVRVGAGDGGKGRMRSDEKWVDGVVAAPSRSWSRAFIRRWETIAHCGMASCRPAFCLIHG
ncbi:hypothetical protein AMAG_16237 [Allomyces macrogynus ATCC 38327]|uniref:Uncharacterized protein n=1 Tax=Allomyces macrogynus (strain ATCC 38327) TaxID=578462 RepID=A0A0L0TAF3_ALLM3|nr:hypothetical protein AMAG_16237 [Allomyces macrogynus ATCC 38327]|eukprot:KNE71685.1 hypothetical protein AMAG_16237 [Allomyces macrogynus ATCC 38327]